MRKANQLVSSTLVEVGRHIKPGVSTLYLDQIAETFIRDHGAIPTFKGYPNSMGQPFPASICTSVNHFVVHGIPSSQEILRDGDIVSVDCGACLNNYNGDSCYTFCVGDVKESIKNLLRVTKKALYLGIEQAVTGNHIGDIGFAVQSYCESHGYGVVRELTGHGIGKQMHEEPQVPNYGDPGRGQLLIDGMCISIEPMITMGDRHIGLMPDHWGIVTRDGKVAAHFEHTIAIHHGRPEILSTFKDIELLEAN